MPSANEFQPLYIKLVNEEDPLCVMRPALQDIGELFVAIMSSESDFFYIQDSLSGQKHFLNRTFISRMSEDPNAVRVH
jgi:hypothetical protein